MEVFHVYFSEEMWCENSNVSSFTASQYNLRYIKFLVEMLFLKLMKWSVLASGEAIISLSCMRLAH